MTAASEHFQTLFIANPNSANGALGRRWKQVETLLREHLGTVHYKFTRGPGDATELTREALRHGYEMIVAVGGDGTINEVTNGFFDEESKSVIDSKAVLGVLPYGTGGDFRRSIHISEVLHDAIGSLKGKKTRQIDVGHLTFTHHDKKPGQRYFINIASCGLSGLVDKYANQSSKVLGGKVSFAIATLRAMREFKPFRAQVQLDDRDIQSVRLQNLVVANGMFFGGGMKIAPDAKLDDGLFDVVFLGPMNMKELVTRGHRVYAGTHTELDYVTVEHARRVTVTPSAEGDPKILLDVDGETPGTLPATFQILPAAIALKTR